MTFIPGAPEADASTVQVPHETLGQTCANEIHQNVLLGGEKCLVGYAKWAKNYDADLQGEGTPNYQAPEKCAKQLLKVMSTMEGLGDDAKVMDFGAGTGLVGEEILKISPDFCTMDALDFSQEMLDVAETKEIGGRQVYKAFICEAMGDEMSYLKTDEYASAVCCGTFLQGHVGANAVAESIRSIRTGGYFVFTVRKTMCDDPAFEWNKTIGELMAKGTIELVEKTEIYYFEGVYAYLYTIRKL